MSFAISVLFGNIKHEAIVILNAFYEDLFCVLKRFKLGSLFLFKGFHGFQEQLTMCLSSLETEAISKYTPSLIKVLHVDDDAAFLETSKLCLEIQGHFEIKVALSPHDAMEKLKQEEFDVVISDYQMPGKNGLEFLIDLRASGNNVPFILFTGKVREEVAVKALNLGAFRYVDKRGDPETVYSELSTGIHQSFEQRQARE